MSPPPPPAVRVGAASDDPTVTPTSYPAPVKPSSSRLLGAFVVLVALSPLAGCAAGRKGPFAERGAGGGGGGGSPPEDGALPPSEADLPVAPPLTGDPILLPGRAMAEGGGGESNDARARRKGDASEEAMKEKFDAAREAAAAGEDEAALALVAAALATNPKSPWDQRFKALKADVKARHLDTNVLRIDVRPLKDYVGFEEDVDLLVRIRNVGTANVSIRPPDASGPEAVSGSTLVLTMKRTDRDIYAAELSRSWTQSVPLLAEGAQDLAIPPEGVHEIRVRVPAEEVGGAIAGMKVLDLSGELRAGRIVAGLEEPFGRVPIRAGRVVALPANYEPLAADPLGSLSKAVDALAPVHLLVATEFLAPEDRPAAVAILARALTTAPAEMRPAALNALDLLRRAAVGSPLRPLAEPLVSALEAHPEREADVMEGLHVLTLVTLAPDPRLWLDWWRREQRGAGSRVAAEDESRAKTVAVPGAASPRDGAPPPPAFGPAPAK